MTINKENYPAYFLDYYEGRLSEADQAALFDFLGMHPQFQEEFDAFQHLSLPEEQRLPVFPDKASLLRGEITADNCDWYFAAYVEGDLGEAEARQVEAFAAGNPAMARELTLMQHAFLPDTTVPYPGKDSLKQREPGRAKIVVLRQWGSYAAAAAVMMLIAGLLFLRSPQSTDRYLAHDNTDISAAEGQDGPVAVADILPPQQDASAPDEVPATSATERDKPQPETPTTIQPQTIPPSGKEEQQHITLPAPHLLRSVSGRGLAARATPTAGATMQHRTEFAYWSAATTITGYDDDSDADATSGNQEITLAQFAMSGLQQSLPIDFSKAEEHIQNNRIPIWMIAGAGLNRLGDIASDALGLERETDESGRTTAITAGNAFSIRRSR